MISIAGYESQIEIIISNNASTDDTADIISLFQIKYPWIRYHRNDENIGGELNFYTVATMALGEYIWIFGDDDKMEKEAIANVIKRIDSGYNLLIVNYSVWSKDFANLIKPRGLKIVEDQVFDDPSRLLKCFGVHLGYISSVIIQKDIFFRTSYAEFESYAEYGFTFLYTAYVGIALHCHAIFIASPIVLNRSDNHRDFDRWGYFVSGSSLIFEALSVKGYSKNAIISAKHQVLRDNIIPYVLSLSVQGDNDRRRRLDLMLTNYKRNWLFWVVCLPALFVPTFIARIGKKIVLIIRKFQSSNFTKIKNIC